MSEKIEKKLHDQAAKLFAQHGVDRVDVEAGEDQAGMPVINVLVFHRLLDRPLEFRSLFPLDRELRDAAWDAGERRFVHVKHQYDDKQQFVSAK